MEIGLKELPNIFSERLLSPVFIMKGKQKMFEVFVITTLIIKWLPINLNDLFYMGNSAWNLKMKWHRICTVLIELRVNSSLMVCNGQFCRESASDSLNNISLKLRIEQLFCWLIRFYLMLVSLRVCWISPHTN